MTFRAVMFDLDGTLLDTLADLADAVNQALTSLDCPEHPYEAYRIYVGDGVESLIRRSLPKDRCDDETVKTAAKIMQTIYAENWDVKTAPYDGVPDLLGGCVAAGLPMSILSNKPERYMPRIVNRWLSAWPFFIVRGKHPDFPKKPDPTSALDILKQMDVAPQDCLYLGDTDTDMQTAVAAGMYAVGALWGFRAADELTRHGAKVLCEHPRDVLALL